MHECFCAGLARKHRNALSGFHVDRVKCVFPALDVKTDGVDNGPGAGNGSRYRAIITDVCVKRFDAGNFVGKQRKDRIGMPASDPSDETGIIKMAHNATAEKSRTAKDSHARRHDAKISRRLQLSHSHSAGDESRHRAGASQTALVSRQGVSLVDTSSIESTVA
jgi:hypothetical protein